MLCSDASQMTKSMSKLQITLYSDIYNTYRRKNSRLLVFGVYIHDCVSVDVGQGWEHMQSPGWKKGWLGNIGLPRYTTVSDGMSR